MNKLIQKLKLKRLQSRKLNNESTDINKYISDLKKYDFSLMKTIMELRRKLNIDIPQSTQLVINSPTWISEKENFISFNQQMQDIMVEEADKVETDKDGNTTITFDLTDFDE